jgi:hypothetical protein
MVAKALPEPFHNGVRHDDEHSAGGNLRFSDNEIFIPGEFRIDEPLH